MRFALAHAAMSPANFEGPLCLRLDIQKRPQRPGRQPAHRRRLRSRDRRRAPHSGLAWRRRI